MALLNENEVIHILAKNVSMTSIIDISDHKKKQLYYILLSSLVSMTHFLNDHHQVHSVKSLDIRYTQSKDWKTKQLKVQLVNY
jgi:hypothetical protein